jgi:hypothetical protein
MVTWSAMGGFTCTSFSPRATLRTISRRAALSGFALRRYSALSISSSSLLWEVSALRCGVGGVQWATRSRPVHGSTFHRVARCSTRPTVPSEGWCRGAKYVRGAAALLASKRFVVNVGWLSICNRLGRVHEKCKVGGHGTRAPANRGRRDG